MARKINIPFQVVPVVIFSLLCGPALGGPSCWRFNESGGEKAFDSLGGYHATIRGNPVWVNGSFGSDGTTFRMDAGVADAISGGVRPVEGVSGPIENIFKIEKAMVFKIVTELGLILTDAGWPDEVEQVVPQPPELRCAQSVVAGGPQHGEVEAVGLGWDGGYPRIKAGALQQGLDLLAEVGAVAVLA